MVLSRKKNEGIVIILGDQVMRVSVAEIRGDKVRLGLDVPRDIPVHRDEVWAEIQAARKRDGRPNA